MRNYVQPGDTITLTAPAGGVTSGQGVLKGRLFVVATDDAEEGEPFEGMTYGVFDFPKAAVAFSEGDPAFWDAAGSRVVKEDDEGANTQVGYVVRDHLAGEAEARVKLLQTALFVEVEA